MFEKKTIVVSFNQEYVNYACAYISSFLQLNHDWEINCLAVNVNTLKHYPWTDSRVHIKYQNVQFISDYTNIPANKRYYYNSEKCYMTTCRFDFLKELIPNYNLLVLTDVDCIAIKSFIELENQMSNSDIGLVKTSNTEPKFAVYSAACVAFNTQNISNIIKWLEIWNENLRNLPTYFFNDQQAIYETIQKYKLQYQFLNSNLYCNFKKDKDTVLLMTAGRIKETRSNDYNEEYKNSWKFIERKRLICQML